MNWDVILMWGAGFAVAALLLILLVLNWGRLFGRRGPHLHNHLLGNEDFDGASVGGNFGGRAIVQLTKHIANLSRDGSDPVRWLAGEEARSAFRNWNRTDTLAFMLSASHNGRGASFDPAEVPFHDVMEGDFEVVPGSVRIYLNSVDVTPTNGAVILPDSSDERTWQDIASLAGKPDEQIQAGKAFIVTYRVRRRRHAQASTHGLPPGAANVTP